VLRPGGRLVVNGIDMDALTIDSPDREVTRRIIHYACDVATHGWAGRQLFGWCKELGLADVSVTPVAAAFHEFEPFYEIVLRTVVEDATAAGTVTAAEAARWVADLRERDRRGLFFYSQTFFRVAAVKCSRQ
jgi:nucleotide-binding universal stress UspA family protein